MHYLMPNCQIKWQF